MALYRWKGVIGVLLAVFVSMLAGQAVLAGGWSVLTIEELPAEVVAGETFTIDFVVRQHGRTPLGGLSGSVQATHTATGEIATFAYRPAGRPGRYTTEMKLAQPGEWQWSIDAFGQHVMPPLAVSEAVAAAAAPPTALSAAPLLSTVWRAGLLAALAIGVTLLLAGWRLASRPAQAAAAVLLVATTLIALSGSVATPAPVAAQSGPEPFEAAAVARGEALFVAKGCITCHRHERAASGHSLSDFGPNLTGYHNDAGFLRQWLRDPAAVRPDTGMPNLELAEAEIEALVSFLNAAAPKT